jgi:hypothetical protein
MAGIVRPLFNKSRRAVVPAEGASCRYVEDRIRDAIEKLGFTGEGVDISEDEGVVHIKITGLSGSSSFPFAVTDHGDGTFAVAPGFVFTASYTGATDSRQRHVPVIGGVPLDAGTAPILIGGLGDAYIVLEATFDMQDGRAKNQPWPITFHGSAPADINIVRGGPDTGGVDGLYYILIWSSDDDQVMRNNIQASILYDRLYLQG